MISDGFNLVMNSLDIYNLLSYILGTSVPVVQEQEKHKEKSMVVYPERGEYYEKPSKRKGDMQIYGINKK